MSEISVRDIASFLEDRAPLSIQEDYDNSGLLVGDPGMRVGGVLISLDCTESVVDEAIRKGCNLIVSHHPIIFRGLKRLTGSNYVERTVMKAIKHSIALYAIHTNLDNISSGVNKKIADRLALESTSILLSKSHQLLKLSVFTPETHANQVRDALFSAGAGHIGNYDECSFSVLGSGTFRAMDGAEPFVGSRGQRHSEREERIEVVLPRHRLSAILQHLMKEHPYEEVAYDLYPIENDYKEIGAGMIGYLKNPMAKKEFIAHVKEKMNLAFLKCTEGPDEIRKVAICGGAGSFLINKAKSAGADAFISGDMKHHEFFDAEGKMLVLDIGHYESERYTIDLLHEWISEKFTTFALLKSEINTNPVNYH